MRYRLEAGTLIVPDQDGSVIRHGQITWEGQEILTVGPLDENAPPVDQVIQIPHGIVMPGLYNGHNHAAMTLLRGYADDSPFFEWLQTHILPAEAQLTSEDIYWGTLLAAAEMIRSGTVGFADMYFEVDAVAEAVMRSGLRSWISRGLVGDDDPTRTKLQESLDWASRWRRRGDGRIIPMLGPHAPYTCDPDYLRDVAQAARAEDLGIHIHLAESEDEIHLLKQRYNKSPAEIALETGILENRVLIAHGIHFSDDDLKVLQRHLTGGIISCPVSNAKLGNGILPFQKIQDHQIPVGLGSDGAASTNTLDMFQEMKAMAWLQKVRTHEPHRFTAKDALKTATTGTASVLGSDGGILAAGHPADFIVVDGSRTHLTPEWDVIANLVYAATGADVSYTVVAGQILMAEGIITAFDESEVQHQVRDRTRRLSGGAHGGL